jgi:hypothetical protein
METLVLVVGAEAWDLPALALVLGGTLRGAVLEISQVDSSSSAYAYACVMRPGEEEGLFEDWPEALIPDGPFTAFSIDYRRPALAEAIVRAVAREAPAVVDTNFGDVLSAEEFLSRVNQSSGEWDWWRWSD